MLLYYAMGGGLGHLTRARAFLHTTGLGEGATLFASSRFADDPRVTGGLPVVKVPAGLDGDPEGLRELLERTIAGLGVRRLVVDAFPAGLLGELAAFHAPAGLELWHVARLLRWERYAADASSRLPRFERTFVLEELHGEHRRALGAASGELLPLDLVDPPSAAQDPVEPPYALVVHGGPDEETADLLACARELLRASPGPARLVLASPERPGDLPPDVTWLDRFPAAGLFAAAERIVTAAGFNAVRQTEPHRRRRFLVPYSRRFDDQFARAARSR
ncbi:MAG: hypothetical protein IPP07_16670 [Holophagales bacterium]|jgi:hypothetical protein|nr:hypothetical protein [Holophagales bacterium]MBK9966430.1 hypothetical protein [Holophagales bacterium]